MGVSGSTAHRRGVARRLALYVLGILSPVIVRAALGSGYDGPVHAVALVTGMTGYAVLALQPVLAARFRWLESPFGLDRVIRFHRATGVDGALLVIVHPVMLAVAWGSTGIFTSFELPWPSVAARATLLVLLLFGTAAVFRKALRLPFQWWFRGHSWTTPAILAGIFLHSYFVGIRSLPLPMRLLWFPLLLAGVFSHLHLVLFRRLSGRLRPWLVRSVEKLNHDVWDIRLEPVKGGRAFRYLPGQFLFVAFLGSGEVPREEHPFTISSSPTLDGSVCISPKESGDFTRRIGRLKQGDRAALMAPYGRFSHLLRASRQDLFFVAGGIGITPMISMLRYMRDSGSKTDVLLIYAARTREDLVFRSEIEEMEHSNGSPGVRMVPVLSRPGPGWEGESGYLDGERLERLVGEVEGRDFYVCGPPPMMALVEKSLRGMGVDGSRIVMERSSL